MSLKVEVARFKPFYAGLILAMVLVALTPAIASTLCLAERSPSTSPCGSLLLLLAAALATAVVHEAVHYLAARMLGVPGLRVVFSKRIIGLVMDYDYMRPSHYPIVALAPQAMTPLLILAARATEGTLSLVYCVAAAVNLAGGAPDIVNALYFTLVHHDAKRFRLLYSENGDIAGGVVEYDDKVIVYTI